MPSHSTMIGTQVGRYHVYDFLGEGAMGEVYLAEDITAPGKSVALKVIKLGLDGDQILNRFANEQRILRRLDHPRIARHLESGVTSAGRAYFAMEYVQGTAITRYCSQRQLDIDARLRLFASVCEAVQFATDNHVVHRDLKPTNILVTDQTGHPEVTIIDFGLAKALSPEFTAETKLSLGLQWLGTPGYMSPEQAQGSSDVDCRTDVYALGVILFELLTGTLPLQFGDPRQLDIEAWRYRILEDDTPCPSERLLLVDESHCRDICASRGAERSDLIKRLRGELDAITQCALARHRNDRYVNAGCLAADVRAHLANRPISIGSSRRQRFSRWVMRHDRTIKRIAMGCLTGLLAAMAASSWFLLRREHIRAQVSEDHAIHQQFVDDVQIAGQRMKHGRTLQAREKISSYLDDVSPYSDHLAINYLRARLPQPRRVLEGSQHTISQIDIDPRDRWIVAGDTGGDILIWDRATGRLVRSLHPSDEE
ncbi:MAG: protein kinase, partial [Planctomycetales bacterium]|nr:protein kinase [Planctomycetales bacterium]